MNTTLTGARRTGIRRALALGGAAVLSAAVLMGTMSACKRMGGVRARLTAKQLAHSVNIDGIPITVGQFTGLDIENPWGDIEVRAASRNEYAMVEFRVRKERWLRWRMAKEGIEFDPVGEYFTASYEVAEGSLNQAGTLIIRPTDLDIEGFRPPIDVVVTIPRCDGARVRTTRGTVKITGVTGAIDVVNGSDTIEGGDIVIRSGERPIEEVMAYTSRGDIHLLLSPENTGVFDLRAPRGKPVFQSDFGYVDNSIPEPGRWTGVWNEGTNAISLQSEDGDAKVRVIENPHLFKP